jgi:hypothetical protein
MIEGKSRGLGLWWLTDGVLLWSIKVMVSRERRCSGGVDSRGVEDGSQPSDGDHSFSGVVQAEGANGLVEQDSEITVLLPLKEQSVAMTSPSRGATWLSSHNRRGGDVAAGSTLAARLR